MNHLKDKSFFVKFQERHYTIDYVTCELFRFDEIVPFLAERKNNTHEAMKTPQPPFSFEFEIPYDNHQNPGEGYYYWVTPTAYDMGGQKSVYPMWSDEIHVIPELFVAQFFAWRDNWLVPIDSTYRVNDLAQIEITFYGHDMQPVRDQDITVTISYNDEFYDEPTLTDKNGKIKIEKQLGSETGMLMVRAETQYVCPIHLKEHRLVSPIHVRIIDKPEGNLYASMLDTTKLPIPKLPIKDLAQNRVSMNSADATWEKAVPLVGDPWLDQFNLAFYDIPSQPYDFKFVYKDSLSQEPIPGQKILLKCPQFPLAVANRYGYTDGNGEVIFRNIVFPGDPIWAIMTRDTIEVIAHLDGATEPFAEDEYDKAKLIPPSHAPEIWMEGLTIMARDLDGDMTARDITVERVDPLAGGLVYLSTHKKSTEYEDDPNTIWDETVWQAAYYSNLPKLSVIFVVEDMAGNRTELHKTFVAP